MQRRFWMAALTAVAAATVAGTPLSAQDLSSSGDISTGKWLVDLGRDYPLTPQAGLSDFDAEIALLFMEAAERVEPDLAEAIRWQVDLLAALGRTSQALEALQRYVRHAPADVDAYVTLVASELDQIQTADQRRDYCQRQLEQDDLPAEVVSELHRTLAIYHWNRGDESQARQEVEQALRADPDDVAARVLLARLTTDHDPLVARVDQWLTRLKSNPGDAELAAQLADRLMLLNLPEDAERWYRHAADVVAVQAPEAVPPEWLAGRAMALLAINRPLDAERLAMAALERNPSSIEVLVSRAMVAAVRGDRDALSRHLQNVGQIAQALLEQTEDEEPPPSLVGEVAWLYTHYLDRSDEAQRLARQLLEADPGDVLAQRVLGTALRRTQRWSEAEERLQPIADRDTWAAIERARTLEGAGRREDAADQLREAGRMPATFEQRRVIRSLAAEWQIEVTVTPPGAEKVRALLESFPPEVLNYPLRPEAYLSVHLEEPSGDTVPGQPWWCTLRLDNVGSFPITFGPDGMIDTEIVCVVQTRGDRTRTSGSSIRIQLAGLRRLAPGQQLEVRQTVKLGRIRAGMIGTPQMSQEVEVTAILNAVEYEEGEKVVCRPGLGGLRVGPVRFRRHPFVGSAANVQQLIAQSVSAEVDARIAAVRILAMLLGEHQHLAAGRLTYPAPAIDAETVRAALTERTDDPDWRVRARLAEAMRWFVLDESTMPAAMQLVDDEHWLVRGLSRRMLIEQTGQDGKAVLRRSTETDPDPWVRRMSTALLGRLALATAAATASDGPIDRPAGGEAAR